MCIFNLQFAVSVPNMPLQSNDQSLGIVPPSPDAYWSEEKLEDGKTCGDYSSSSLERFFSDFNCPAFFFRVAVLLKWKIAWNKKMAKIKEYEVYYYREIPDMVYTSDVWEIFETCPSTFLKICEVNIVIISRFSHEWCFK